MGIVRGTRRARVVIGFAAVASAGLMAVNSAAASTPAAPTAPSTSLAAYSASFGFNGHAGLYGYGMGFDAAKGTILVADLWNYRVQVFSESGSHIKNVGKVAPRGAQGGMGAPFGVAADPDGNIWVGDQSNSRVVEFNYDTGAWMQSIGSGGGPNAGENYPVGCGGGKMTIPTHVAVDPATRNVYVTDPRCGGVYVFNNTGTYLFQFTWSTLKHPIPRGIGMDNAGNVYVAEFNTRKIYVFNKAGQQLRVFAGTPNGTDMADVRGIAVDSVNQRVYAVGAENNKVAVFGFAGNYIATWSSPGNGTNFSSIRFVATDQSGNVYVSDLYGYLVYKFDKNGSLLPWSTGPEPPPNGGWNQLNGVAIDPSTGYLYAIDTFGNRVQVFDTNGQSCASKTSCAAFVVAFGQRGPLTPNSPNLDYPHVPAIGTQHDLWMDGTNSLIHWDISNISSSNPPAFLGTQGVHGKELAAFKNGPQGMQIAPYNGNNSAIYTVDTGNCRIQIFDYSGNLLGHMGGCGNATDQMSAPRQLVVDAANHHVYVADTGHSRIAEWDTNTGHMIATFTTAGGTHLNQPRGVTISPDGQWIYVGDSGNDRIVRVLANGMPSASAAVVTTGADIPGKGHLGGPEWMTFSPKDGRLFVSDNNQSVYAFTITG